MEVIDLNSLDPITMHIGESNTKTTNFGSGIELLMNDKMKSSSSSTKIDLGELDNLENELMIWFEYISEYCDKSLSVDSVNPVITNGTEV